MKIALFNPTGYVGGASVLFFRIFNHLKEKGEDVVAIDLVDGYIASNLSTDDTDVVIIKSCTNVVKSHDFDNRVFVCTTTMTKCLRVFCNSNNIDPDFISWVVHPYEMSMDFIPHGRLIATIFGFRIAKLYSYLYPSKCKSLSLWYEEAINNGSIYFMDAPCINSTRYFLNTSKNVDDAFLPIPCLTGGNINWDPDRFNRKKIRLCYFGRLEDFKTGPLLGVLKDINRLVKENNYNVQFTIIGGGRDLQKIKLYAKREILYPIEYKGVMSNSEARSWICKNSDILFAMGTAALDGASLGVPTIIINASFDNLSLFNLNDLLMDESSSLKQKILSLYRKFFSSAKMMQVGEMYSQKLFSLGDYEDNPFFSFSGKTIEKQLEIFFDNPGVYSKKCKAYVQNNHSIDRVCSKLIDSILKVNYKVSDIPRI